MPSEINRIDPAALGESYMRQKSRAMIAVIAAIPLLVVLALPGVAQAEEPGVVGEPTSLGERIAEAAEGGAVGPEQIAEAVSLPVEGGGSLTFDDAQRITATVIFSGAPDAAVLAQLESLAVVESLLSPFPAATIRVAPDQISAIEAISGVVSVTPALSPQAGTGELPATGTLRPAAQTPAGAACGPIPIDADAPLRSDAARAAFGVDGTGVTIGILSDSFDQTVSPTSWADDVAAGALPGAGNPCGRTTPVEILPGSFTASGGADEGRAMAQLVHGIAPGAQLMFAGGGNSELEMAQNILGLAEAGATVIVDDLTWYSEAYYQQGFLSAAIEQAKREHGVTYFTSAGNSNGVGSSGASSGKPVASWQTTAYRPAACPAWVAVAAGADCLDFDPDAAVETPFDTLKIKGTQPGADIELTPIASISEPVFGVTTSYELRFYNADPALPEPALISTLSSFGGPFPGLSGSVEVPRGGEVRMVMVRTAHDAAEARPPAVFLGFMRGGGAIAERAFIGNGVTDWVGEMVFGHSGDGSAIGTASLDWANPTELRGYSSLGPSTLIYDTASLEFPTPAARKVSPVIVDSPQIASVDGVQTTFFGEEDPAEPGVYRFYGTSAAAPNAAAVAALGLSYAPELTGAQLRDSVLATARGTSDGGPVNPFGPDSAYGLLNTADPAVFPDKHVFGAGIVDAMGLIESLPARPTAPLDLAITGATVSSFNASWAASGQRHLIELFAGDPSSGTLVASERVAATVSARSFTGLPANTAYTVRLTPVGALGTVGTPATIGARTAAPAPDPGPGGEGGAGQPAKGGSGAGLSATGSQDMTLWFVAGGAVLVLGIGLIVGGRLVAAKRRRATAGSGNAEVVAAEPPAEIS